MTAQSTTSRLPLMNWTQVVETMPAVMTMVVTMQPTTITPMLWGTPINGRASAPAPTICGMR